VRAYFAAASARRAIYPHRCAQCGEAFMGIAQARYCSRRCRVRAYRQRRAQQAGQD
jgi:predicted nucleic acid-binding Zn ribbon protein